MFVANPNKTRAVVEILYNNKEKLLKYLDDFHNDRGGPARSVAKEACMTTACARPLKTSSG